MADVSWFSAINKEISGLHEVTVFEQRDMDARALGFKIGETPFDPISSIDLGRSGLSCGSGDNFVIDGEYLATDLVDMEASNIWKIWLETNDPLINEDFYRGLKFMYNGDLEKSIVFFTKVRCERF